MKRIFIAFGILVALGIALALGIYGIYLRPFMNKMMHTQVNHYDKQLTLILGGGGNTGILVSDSVVLVIDTKMQQPAEELSQTVADLAGKKPIIVVNTHVHNDHTGGNKYYKGQTIIAGGNYDKDFWNNDAGPESTPTVWVKDSLVLHIGDETVVILNLPFAAHTQSDVVVYLQNRKMLFGGDVILNKQAPALFAKYNSDPNGYLKAFDLVEQRFDIANVIPGHGNFGGKEILDNYRAYFKDLETAATDPAREKELLSKYGNYNQIPLLMSSGAALRYIRAAKK